VTESGVGNLVRPPRPKAAAFLDEDLVTVEIDYLCRSAVGSEQWAPDRRSELEFLPIRRSARRRLTELGTQVETEIAVANEVQSELRGLVNYYAYDAYPDRPVWE
jgi:hypothetical protein